MKPPLTLLRTVFRGTEASIYAEKARLLQNVAKHRRFSFAGSRSCSSAHLGYRKAEEILGRGPYVLEAECWTFDWNMGFLTDRMNPSLYFTFKSVESGKSIKLRYSVKVTGYGLKFSTLLLVFGFRSEYSTFGSGVYSKDNKTVLINRIPTTITIKPTGSIEYSMMGSNFVTWTLEVEGKPLGRLTRVGTQYLGAGPLLGYMLFREVSVFNRLCLHPNAYFCTHRPLQGKIMLTDDGKTSQKPCNRALFIAVTYGPYSLLLFLGSLAVSHLIGKAHEAISNALPAPLPNFTPVAIAAATTTASAAASAAGIFETESGMGSVTVAGVARIGLQTNKLDTPRSAAAVATALTQGSSDPSSMPTSSDP